MHLKKLSIIKAEMHEDEYVKLDRKQTKSPSMLEELNGTNKETKD